MIPYSDIVIRGGEISPLTVLIVVGIIVGILAAIWFAKRL